MQCIDNVASLLAALEARRRSGDTQPATLRLEPGEYFLDTPLLLGPEESGLTVEGAGDGEATIHAGRPVTGWEKEEGPFYAAALPDVDGLTWDFRCLVVNDRLAPRARLPDEGTFTHLTDFNVRWMSTTGGGWQRKPTQEELTTLRYRSEDLPATLDLRNAELTIFHMWDESLVGVTAQDHACCALTFSPAGHPPGAFGVHDYVVWNVRKGMTRPGQWYFDRNRCKLVYWPLPGEDMSRARVFAPAAASGLVIRGTEDRPVQDLTFRRLRLSTTTTPLAAGGFGASRYDGALHAVHTRNCRFAELLVANVGGHGIKAAGDDLRIENCQVYSAGAGGILFSGHGCTVRNNQIHRIGVIHSSAIGLWGQGASTRKARIDHNEVHHTPYTALACGGEGNEITANRLHHAMRRLHDGAGIYITFCREIAVRSNFVHDIADTGGYGASAYYLDEQAKDCLVEGNLSLRVARPSHNHMAGPNTIENNVFVTEGDMSLTFPKSTDYTFRRNVLQAGGCIGFDNPEAIRDSEANVFFSATGSVSGNGERDVIAEPGLQGLDAGRVDFSAASPCRSLGIKPIDVTGAGVDRSPA